MSSLGIRLFALAALLLASASTQAQLFRAYVSGSGNDANPCTLQSPCRLLPRALQAVADGGEIWMVGSANYNTSTVVVTKSVRILAIPERWAASSRRTSHLRYRFPRTVSG